MKYILFVLSLACSSIAVAQKENDLLGKQFYRADKKAAVCFYKGENGYEARTIWLMYPLDKKTGKPRTDKYNPDISKRSTPLIGLSVMYNLKYQNNSWIGEAYHPAHGLTAQVELSLTKDGNLKVTGRKWGIAKSEIWEKVEKNLQ